MQTRNFRSLRFPRKAAIKYFRLHGRRAIFMSRAAIAVSVFIFCLLPLAGQQGRGSIQGNVTDSSGAAISGVTVVVTNVDTNSVYNTETTGEGFYAAPTLPVGNYTIAAERPGFKRAV